MWEIYSPQQVINELVRLKFVNEEDGTFWAATEMQYMTPGKLDKVYYDRIWHGMKFGKQEIKLIIDHNKRLRKTIEIDRQKLSILVEKNIIVIDKFGYIRDINKDEKYDVSSFGLFDQVDIVSTPTDTVKIYKMVVHPATWHWGE